MNDCHRVRVFLRSPMGKKTLAASIPCKTREEARSVGFTAEMEIVDGVDAFEIVASDGIVIERWVHVGHGWYFQRP